MKFGAESMPQVRSASDEVLRGIEGVASFENGVLSFVTGINAIPEEIFEYATAIRHINLNGSGLRTLPETFSTLVNLEVVFLGGSKSLEEVPDFSHNQKLKIIGLQNCGLSEFPEGRIPSSCEWLMLTNNVLTSLPESIGELSALRKLALAGNALESLPDQMQHCRELELLRISGNNLDSCPEWILELPKLAYFTDSGNNYNRTRYGFVDEVPTITEEEVVIDKDVLLGKSPSASIYGGTLVSTGEPIAYKAYVNNAMTSDGYTIDEREAFICVSDHPHIVPITGIVESSSGLKNIIMPLLAGYKKLGNPPNFETVTRDTFGGGEYIPVEDVVTLHLLIKQIASAMSHMHEKSVSHGDLYAHNILLNPEHNTYVSDFGAASFYEDDPASLREKIDVRAFGYFIEDMLQQLPETMDTDPTQEMLEDLMALTLTEVVALRPTFDEIKTALDSVVL